MELLLPAQHPTRTLRPLLQPPQHVPKLHSLTHWGQKKI